VSPHPLKTRSLCLFLSACALSFVLAWLLAQPALALVGLMGLGYLGLRYPAELYRAGERIRWLLRRMEPKRTVLPAPSEFDPQGTDALVEQMLHQSRYALLLRPQIAENLSDRQYRRAFEALERSMALVPDGEVLLGDTDDAYGEQREEEAGLAADAGRVVRVEHFFLDRFLVTNEQFREFVAGGGYEQLNLWDETIWPAILDLVDRTGRPGPAFWSHGRCPLGLERHPVTGVSWFEAMAYARWAGKRLPTDAEWVKAACWPVSLSASNRLQRRYPWGDSMERHRANLWGSGPEGTCAVDACPDGVSVGGVYQLIGNVWEWTRGDFRGLGGRQGSWTLETPMKSLRGGAFDTYFDNQATCQFQSGDVALARKHNIGFRCALSVCDLLLTRGLSSDLEQLSDSLMVEEVHA